MTEVGSTVFGKRGEPLRLSRAAEAIPPSGIREFFDVVSRMDDVISLGVGEPDFGTAWRVREAAIYGLPLIDDAKGTTLAAASSLDEGVKGAVKTGADMAAAKAVGKLIAERAKEKKIDAVVFDRGRFLYHGRVKALADAAREAGLSF